MCGIVGGRVLWAFESPIQAHWRSLFLRPVDYNVELSATFLAPCLPGCCHPPYRDDSGPNIGNFKQAAIECFLVQVLPWSWCLFTVTGH